MEPRQLSFDDFAQVRAELDRLQTDGYRPAGQWDLARACDHLTFFIRGSLDGHPYRVPWLFKVLFGRLVLRRILTQRRMKPGVPTPHKNPSPPNDVSAAVAQLKEALARFESHRGEYRASPFFGALTPDQWRELHLIHCAHHLGYLVPSSG